MQVLLPAVMEEDFDFDVDHEFQFRQLQLEGGSMDLEESLEHQKDILPYTASKNLPVWQLIIM